jgi:FkbM family methyltransferase
MSNHLVEYVRCLNRYRRLAGLGETGRLLGSIMASKAGVAPGMEAQRAMQRWAFFQILAREPAVRVSRVAKNEFRVFYRGEKEKLGGVEVALRMPDCDSSDPRVFEQIFLMKDYAHVLEWFSAVSPGKEINTIIDIGANIGCSALFFCTWLPAPDIFCLEPEESNYTRLLLNISLNRHRQIRCHRAALWTQLGNLNCSHDFRDGKEWGARFVEAPGDDKANVQQVAAIDINGLMAQTGFTQVNFLKMDIEGAEADLFRTQLFRDFLKEKVSRVAVEVHEEFIKIDEVTTILTALGFQTKTISEFVCAIKAP